MRRHLEGRLKKAGSLRRLAVELGVSPTHLSDVIAGQRGLDRVAERLGFTVETTKRYRRARRQARGESGAIKPMAT